MALNRTLLRRRPPRTYTDWNRTVVWQGLSGTVKGRCNTVTPYVQAVGIVVTRHYGGQPSYDIV